MTLTDATCVITGCNGPIHNKANGWCRKHYARWYRHGDPLTLLVNPDEHTACQVPGCDRPYYGRGYCTPHYTAWYRHGDPLTVVAVPAKPFDHYYDPSVGLDACWPWGGNINADGYGRWWSKGKSYAAHRLAWENIHGPIPEGLVMDHTCHDPRTCVSGNTCPHRRCVNPNHLRPVTVKENSAPNRRRTAARGCKCACGCC